jgi:ABC-type glycerol-3-phosphate transport system substrate-binding protein
MITNIKSGILLFFLFVLLLTSSCKSKINVDGGKALTSENTIKLNWIGHWYGEGNREKLVREIANEFEFTNQNVAVNLKFPHEVYFKDDPSEIDFIIKQIQMSQSEWDIIRLKDHYYTIAGMLQNPNWGEKYLVDLSQYPEFVKTQQSFVFDPLIKSQNGTISPGPFNEGFYWAVWFNDSLAKKIGITVKQYDMTIDDFIGYIKAVSEYNKANNTHIAGILENKDWITSEVLQVYLSFSAMGSYNEIMNTELTPVKLAALEKSYKALEELSKYKPIIRSRKDVGWPTQYLQYALNDSCLFFFNGSWMYNMFNGMDKLKMKKILPCELPVFESCDTYIGGYKACWAIPKNAPHKEAAIKMFLYWSRPEVAEKWSRYTKCPTGVKGSLTTSSFGFDPYETFEYTVSKKYGPKKINPTDSRYVLGAKNYKIPLGTIDVLEGRLTAEQAFREIKKKLVH